MSHTKVDVKQKGQVKKKKQTASYIHTNIKAEFSEKLHPGKCFTKSSGFSGLKICLDMWTKS